MTEKSGGNPPPIVFSFHDWNKAGFQVDKRVLQTFHDPMENDFVTPLQLAERISQDGGVLAVAWMRWAIFSSIPTTGPVAGISDEMVGHFRQEIRRLHSQSRRQIKAFGKRSCCRQRASSRATYFFTRRRIRSAKKCLIDHRE